MICFEITYTVTVLNKNTKEKKHSLYEKPRPAANAVKHDWVSFHSSGFTYLFSLVNWFTSYRVGVDENIFELVHGKQSSQLKFLLGWLK